MFVELPGREHCPDRNRWQRARLCYADHNGLTDLYNSVESKSIWVEFLSKSLQNFELSELSGGHDHDLLSALLPPFWDQLVLEPRFFQFSQDNAPFCFTQIEFGFDFIPLHMITFTLRTTHKFFHLLISTCSKAYLSHCEQSWLSIPIQTCFLHPPTFFFSTKLKSAEKLNTAVMYGAELRLPLFLSLIGFNKRLFDQRVTPP